MTRIDVRRVFRVFTKDPACFATVVVIMALSIGFCSAIKGVTPANEMPIGCLCGGRSSDGFEGVMNFVFGISAWPQ
jgi:hypothetical protein